MSVKVLNIYRLLTVDTSNLYNSVSEEAVELFNN